MLAKKMLDAMTYRGNRFILGLTMGRASYCHSMAYGLSRGVRRNPRNETEQPCNGVRLRKRDGSRLERSHQFEEQGGQLDRDSLWRGRLWPWWRHCDETSLCEAGRFVYIMLIGVDISERLVNDDQAILGKLAKYLGKHGK